MGVIIDMFDEGMSEEEIGRALGYKPRVVRDRLRKTGRLDHVPASIWDLSEDERRDEFIRRASRAAGRRMKELGIERA